MKMYNTHIVDSKFLFHGIQPGEIKVQVYWDICIIIILLTKIYWVIMHQDLCQMHYKECPN